jgi:hypothetical protein
MQQIATGTEVQWSDAANSFVLPASPAFPAIPIPTKLFEYDRQSRLSAVVLPRPPADPYPAAGVRQAFQPDLLPDQLPFPETDAARLPFTEYFAYNDLGQQTLHLSFEGIVTAFVYGDSPGSGGRLLEKQFFTDLDAYHAAPSEPDEVWAFTPGQLARLRHRLHLRSGRQPSAEADRYRSCVHGPGSVRNVFV